MEDVKKNETNCYTYEVRMVVQVLAQNEAQASEKLDLEGGFVSRRDVTYLNSTAIPTEKD